MSDMNDKKDYDLDYFNSHSDDADAKSDDFSSNGGIDGDDSFDLNGFSSGSDIGDSQPFAVADSGESDDNGDL